MFLQIFLAGQTVLKGSFHEMGISNQKMLFCWKIYKNFNSVFGQNDQGDNSEKPDKTNKMTCFYHFQTLQPF